MEVELDDRNSSPAQASLTRHLDLMRADG